MCKIGVGAFKGSVFSVCTDYLHISQKRVCTKITIFFHFFQTIASCDHQLTSEGQLVRPFSLLFAILPLSYDFDNKIFANLIFVFVF